MMGLKAQLLPTLTRLGLLKPLSQNNSLGKPCEVGRLLWALVSQGEEPKPNPQTHAFKPLSWNRASSDMPNCSRGSCVMDR